MTSSAAPSRTRIERSTASARALITTGTPVTTYCAPSRGWKAFSPTACSISAIARRRSASLSSGRIRIWIRAELFDGNR